MPLLLTARAATRPPVGLLTSRDAELLAIRPAEDPTLVRVRRGVYAGRDTWNALAPWQRYAARVHALLLQRPQTVLCLESAAVVHGVPLFGQTRDIHAYDPTLRKSTRFGDVVVHTSRDPREVVDVGGILSTSMLDTVIDLARVLPLAAGLTAVDAAISPVQGGPLTLPTLRDRADAQSNRRGRAHLRWIWARANGCAESPTEVISRAVIEWSGFEEPVQQPVFHYEGHTDRTDFGFRSNHALGESDGWGKYDLGDPARAEAHLRHEKQREDRLRRNGHPFARWDPGGAFRVEPLCRALAGAGLRPVFPAQPALLATLRHNPRALHPRETGLSG
ncbi:hypothetical protein [Microbacterium flavum]|uniref:hypothetical protein n=1 Tax=Microbacterium flavum TaxID=415216 RepID=UPI0024ACAF6A|nr:hypothetical protein [Microbacterium flavum]